MSEEQILEELVFDSTNLIELPVRVGSTKYVLREASGDAACKFQNARVSRYIYNDDGKLKGLRDMADLEPFLVSLCLFMEDKATPISEVTIRSWPQRIQSKLFDKAKAISGLDETDDLAALQKQLDELSKRIEQVKKQESPTKNS